MTVSLIIENEKFANLENTSLIKIAEFTLSNLNIQDNDITIVLSDDETLQDINKTYLGHDFPTDVLSFEAKEVNPESGTDYLGDIIISVDRAIEQSANNKVSLMEELSTLIVHGILHLYGYDHADPVSEVDMFKLQGEILGLSKGNNLE